MTIFFDIDDTLYDRGLPFIEAAQEFFGGTLTDMRRAYRTCTSRGNEVFLPSQRGEISMDEMYIYRWTRGFADVGVRISAEEALAFQTLYRRRQNYIAITPGSERIVRYCRDHADNIGIITNGPSEKQWNKISRLGLERYIDKEMIIVSGDVGIDKPDTEIFRLAERRCGSKPEELLYVGDSLKNDMEPATTCGWHTLWYNCENMPVSGFLRVDATAKCEEELLEELKKWLQT